MSLKVFEDYHALSRETAYEIIGQVRTKPHSVLCLAAGDTPRFCYNLLAEIARNEKVDFSRCTFVGLDEWIGVAPDNEGSCHYFLDRNLFGPLNIRPDQYMLFDAFAKNGNEECRRMEDFISQRQGIDLMLVGIGMNGHIGFNEPGADENSGAHVADLDETTRSVGQKYFQNPTQLVQGLTLGFKNILESRKVLLMASGRKKAEIVRKALQGPVSADVPASIIRKHRHALTLLDKDAAALLTII